MNRAGRTLRLLLAVSLPALGATACVQPGARLAVSPAVPARAAVAAPAVEAPVVLLPPPEAASQRFVPTTGGATLAGLVSLKGVTDPYFADSAAAYRVQAIGAGHAMTVLSTLEEELFTKNGVEVGRTADAAGQFELTGTVPTDRPFVINAYLAQNHRLSAMVAPGTTSVELDEATTMVTELARWQLRPAPGATPEAGEKTQLDLSAADLTDLHTRTRTLLGHIDWTATGDIPNVESLKTGAGFLLRNLYVLALGTRTDALGGLPANPQAAADATALSDSWKALLGFRPLALSRAVGNGIKGYNQGDGKPAAEAELSTPIDAVADALGNLYVTEQATQLIRFVPAADRGGLLGYTGAMTAGKLYTIAGQVNATTSLTTFNQTYNAYSQLSTTTNKPPLVTSTLGLFRPERLKLVPVDPADPAQGNHLYFTSAFGNRLFLIPGAAFSRYNRTFEAGRLYALAGNGDYGGYAPPPTSGGPPLLAPDDPATTEVNEERRRYFLADGNQGYLGALSGPTGLDTDNVHNMYMLDAGVFKGLDLPTAANDSSATYYLTPAEDASIPVGRKVPVYHGNIRYMAASGSQAGKIRSIRLTLGGKPFSLEGAQNLKVVQNGPGDNYFYIAHTKRHVVVRAPMPADLSYPAAPAPIAAEIVLGQLDKPGFIDTAQAIYPNTYDLSDGLPEAQTLLHSPTGLAFDEAGNLIVTGGGRVRLLEAGALAPAVAGKVYTIAGGLNTRYLEGDSRLAYLPATSAISREPSGNFLLVDSRENIVRRLWTLRGAL